MRIYLNLILIVIVIGCKNEKLSISYNPFQPNYSLKTETIMKNGFELKWGCDGGFNTYSIEKKNYELCFFEDCLKPGRIIGENYDFHIDTIKTFNWDLADSLRIDFNSYRNSIEKIILQFDGKLIEPSIYSSLGEFKFTILYVNDSVFDCRLSCNPDGILNLTIENWYENK